MLCLSGFELYSRWYPCFFQQHAMLVLSKRKRRSNIYGAYYLAKFSGGTERLFSVKYLFGEANIG